MPRPSIRISNYTPNPSFYQSMSSRDPIYVGLSFSPMVIPTRHSPSMFSQLTQGCTSINNFPPSLPAARRSSPSPPGWYGRYGVILYTLPWYDDQAGRPFLPLLYLRCEGVTRIRDDTPDKLVPDFSRFAQSSGECPGVRRTF